MVQSLFWVKIADAAIFGSLSLKEELEMGRKFDATLRANVPMIDDPEISLYVRDVVQRLVKSMPPQPFIFTPSVILYNALNAFAVPGGFVYVFSGLLMQLNNEAELAGVLSHELAHVTQRHVAGRLKKSQFVSAASLLLAVAGIALGGKSGAAAAMGAIGAGQSTMLNYSRIDENESDQVGLQYLMAAGYPPSGMVGGFKILRQKSYMSGINIPTYLSTHPDLGERIASIQARIASMPKTMTNKSIDNQRFLRVQTLLWARYGNEQSALKRFQAKKNSLDYLGTAIVLSRRHDIKAAEKAFDQALEVDSRDSLILREAGTFHYRKANLARAEELLTKAIQLEPRDYMAIFFYARLLDESGRLKEAEKNYREVLRYVANDAEVHELLARCLGKMGREAEAWLERSYSAIYSQKIPQATKSLQQAKKLAKTEAERKKIASLEKVLEEYQKIWKQ